MSNKPHWAKVIAGIGNTHILRFHIAYLHKKISSQPETDTEYYCWLLLNCLFIYQKMEHIYIRMNPSTKDLTTIKKSDILQNIKNNFDNDTKAKELQKIYKIIELRDRLVHLGVPNMDVLVTSKYRDDINDIYKGNMINAEKLFNDAQIILKKIELPPVEIVATDKNGKPVGSFGRIGAPTIPKIKYIKDKFPKT